MNHKPAIDWLFADDELSQTQSKVLQEHLAECDSCQDLAESYRQVAFALKRTEQVEPEAGFASRWQARLQASRAKAHRRQIMATLAFVSGGIAGSDRISGFHYLALAALAQSTALDLDLPMDHSVHLYQCDSGGSGAGGLGDNRSNASGGLGVRFWLAQ